ncbi:hypothetical protein V6N12_054679 [Hibiscus sabdariffa]|uniref:Uncharacterized protein n=1 Tax=Hibiscus sabdariffa TaxID=183260 RepID=A0ABR2D149_9ROSI
MAAGTLEFPGLHTTVAALGRSLVGFLQALPLVLSVLRLAAAAGAFVDPDSGPYVSPVPAFNGGHTTKT